MAKRKKGRSKSRGRRMSGVGNQLTGAVAVIAGAAAGRLVSQRVFPNLNPNLKAAGIIALGAFVMPKIVKGSMGQGLGDGMVAAGGLGLLSNFGVISGDDNTVMAGDGLSVLAGDEEDMIAGDGDGIAADNLSVIAGLDEMDF